MVVLFKILDIGSVTSETTTCYIMWPLMHIAYLVLNGFWFWFFFINYSEAANVDLRLLKDNQKINTTIMLFALGFLSLKQGGVDKNVLY